MMWRCCCCCATIGARQSQTCDDDTINILILGLNGSGKTEVSCTLANEKRVDMFPTNGLRLFTRHLGRFPVTFTEIGGNPDIRKIWQHYYHKAFAIIYVVDLSADDDSINESYAVLSDIIRHRYVRGKPILVLANKTDLCDFPDILDFYEHFPLERLANSYQSHVLLQCCGREDYTELHSGVAWLQFHIETNYKQMKNRIEFDVLTKRKEDEQKPEQHKSKISTKGGGSMRSRTISQLGNLLWRPLSAPTHHNNNTTSTSTVVAASKLRVKSACVDQKRIGGGESSWRNHLKRNNRIHSVAVNDEPPGTRMSGSEMNQVDDSSELSARNSKS